MKGLTGVHAQTFMCKHVCVCVRAHVQRTDKAQNHSSEKTMGHGLEHLAAVNSSSLLPVFEGNLVRINPVMETRSKLSYHSTVAYDDPVTYCVIVGHSTVT